MTSERFEPTEEQQAVLSHEGCAFVRACPGAGKTRVLVERARRLLKGRSSGKGIAFLSFTNAAVSELEQRLRREGLLPTPPFPHFLGTFDSFLWQFLIAPFGAPGYDHSPRLIPDKNELGVRLSPQTRVLPLACFDPASGDIIPEAASRLCFDPLESPGLTRAYVKIAASLRSRLLKRGDLDFADVRLLAARRLKDHDFSTRLQIALGARFSEVIVDEAQDCNPADLDTIQWLRGACIVTKVICDPNQSIYGFRGGVGDELESFGQSFDVTDRLTISGNFRSSEAICRTIQALRPRAAGGAPDRPLGENRVFDDPIYIFAYPGTRVPPTIGTKFSELVEARGIDVTCCPVLASTWDSAGSAIGQSRNAGKKDLTLRLASAVTKFHFAFETGNLRGVLEEVHRVVLDIEDRMDSRTYHQYLADEGIDPGAWRPRILGLIRELRYDYSAFPRPDDWLAHARVLLESYLPAAGPTIGQRLRRNKELATALCVAPATAPPAKSIHAVKGMEFPAVCVVMTSHTTPGILEYLETGAPSERAEDARKIYVAASRAQRLLAIATPRSQAARLKALLGATCTAVAVEAL